MVVSLLSLCPRPLRILTTPSSSFCSKSSSRSLLARSAPAQSQRYHVYMHYVRSMAHVPMPQSSLTRQYFESSPSIDIDTDIPKTLFLTQAEASAVHPSRLSYQTPSKQTRQGKESRTKHKDAVRCQAHVLHQPKEKGVGMASQTMSLRIFERVPIHQTNSQPEPQIADAMPPKR
jgi:hypothetical protein